MKKIKVEQNEPFEIKVTVNGTDFYKAEFKITGLKGEEIIPMIGKPYFRMRATIEQGNSMYLEKAK